MLFWVVDNTPAAIRTYLNAADIIIRIVIPIITIISIPISGNNISINSIGISIYFDTLVMPFNTLIPEMLIKGFLYFVFQLSG